MDSTSKEILDRTFELAKNHDGLTALYNINIQKTKMQHKILSESHNKESFFNHIKKIFLTLKEEEFEMLLVDLDERIICKKIDAVNVIVFVTEKEMSLGKIFTLLRGINFQGDTE